MSDRCSQIVFVELPLELRIFGAEDIPPEIIEAGYNPAVGPQVAVYGDLSALLNWAAATGAPDTQVGFGTAGPHIDLYGSQIEQFVPDPSLVITPAQFCARFPHPNFATDIEE